MEKRCGCQAIERKIFSDPTGGIFYKWFCNECGAEFTQVRPLHTYKQLMDETANRERGEENE